MDIGVLKEKVEGHSNGLEKVSIVGGLLKRDVRENEAKLCIFEKGKDTQKPSIV